MARYWGVIGINRGPVQTSPGILTPKIEEVQVSGEMRQERLNWPQAGMREGLSARHVLSVITPEDSDIDFTEAVYISWQGRKWSVTSIQYKRPRVELSLGGIYSG
jgi:hypothetical protein